jgi:hypothetical protein
MAQLAKVRISEVLQPCLSDLCCAGWRMAGLEKGTPLILKIQRLSLSGVTISYVSSRWSRNSDSPASNRHTQSSLFNSEVNHVKASTRLSSGTLAYPHKGSSAAEG